MEKKEIKLLNFFVGRILCVLVVLSALAYSLYNYAPGLFIFSILSFIMIFGIISGYLHSTKIKRLSKMLFLLGPIITGNSIITFNTSKEMLVKSHVGAGFYFFNGCLVFFGIFIYFLFYPKSKKEKK